MVSVRELVFRGRGATEVFERSKAYGGAVRYRRRVPDAEVKCRPKDYIMGGGGS